MSGLSAEPSFGLQEDERLQYNSDAACLNRLDKKNPTSDRDLTGLMVSSKLTTPIKISVIY